jgi:hypothetical protein
MSHYVGSGILDQLSTRTFVPCTAETAELTQHHDVLGTVTVEASSGLAEQVLGTAMYLNTH